MNLWLRLLQLAIFSRRRPACGSLGPCRTPFRVLPTDLDLLRHVNNGKYLSLLDVARVDLMLRAGMAGELRRRKWYPVVTAETIQFYRSLELFDAFEVVTRVIGWDERSLFLEQRFLRAKRGGEEELVAEAIVRARFLAPGRSVPTAELIEAIGVPDDPPELPAWVHAWSDAQERLRADAQTSGWLPRANAKMRA